MKLIKTIFICLFAIACQNNTSSKDSIYIAPNNSIPQFSDVFSKVEIIPLETSDSCLIANINKIIYYNDTIYLLDQKQSQLFIFNGLGKFLWKLDKLGRAPGEYLNIEDFVINPQNKNIEIISATGQYIIYNSQGKMLESYQIPVRAVHEFYPIDENLTVFYEKFNEGTLSIYSKKEKKKIYEKAMSENYIVQNTPYKAITSPFSYNEGQLFFLATDQKKVYRILASPPYLKEYQRFNFGDLDYDIKKLPKDREATFYVEENQEYLKIYDIADFKETSEQMVIYFIYDKFWHTTFYNKKTKQVNTLNKKSGIMIYYPFDCNTCFLSSVVPANLIERQVKKEWVGQEEWGKIQELPMDANPVILKYYFK